MSATLAAEVEVLRTAVGLGVASHVSVLRISGDAMWEALDRVCTSDLFLRDLQLRQTLLLDDAGSPIADAYVANDDDGLLLLAEGLERPALLAHLARCCCDLAVVIEDVSATHTLLSLDGPFAWEAMVALEGPDVIGFPFGSCYHPHPGATYFRAGKTGEFGYLLLAPHDEAAALRTRLVTRCAETCGLREVGHAALRHAALEGWFFDIHEPGTRGLSPIALQLQWRLATESKDYVGRRALEAHAVGERTVALRSDTRDALRAGATIRYGDHAIGRVLVAERSQTLGHDIAIGLVERPLAHSGIRAFEADGVPVVTLSPPFVDNLSLYVRPQQHRWATRAAVAYPGPARRRG